MDEYKLSGMDIWCISDSHNFEKIVKFTTGKTILGISIIMNDINSYDNATNKDRCATSGTE